MTSPATSGKLPYGLRNPNRSSCLHLVVFLLGKPRRGEDPWRGFFHCVMSSTGSAYGRSFSASLSCAMRLQEGGELVRGQDLHGLGVVGPGHHPRKFTFGAGLVVHAVVPVSLPYEEMVGLAVTFPVEYVIVQHPLRSLDTEGPFKGEVLRNGLVFPSGGIHENSSLRHKNSRPENSRGTKNSRCPSCPPYSSATSTRRVSGRLR